MSDLIKGVAIGLAVGVPSGVFGAWLIGYWRYRQWKSGRYNPWR